MATQKYDTLTNLQKEFYERTLLNRLEPVLLYQKFGQKKPMPKNEGAKVNFRRFDSLAAANTPLTEGVTPAGNTIAVTKVEAEVKQYGDFIEISDKLDLLGIDPVLTEMCRVLGKQAALTIDTVIRDVVVSGTNVQYAGGKTDINSITATDKITAEEIKKAVRTLKKNNAKPLKDGYYVGIIDPEVAYDIMNDSLWQDISKYSGGTQIMKGEVGKLCGVRFVETTNNKAENNTGDVKVHKTMIIGEDAYGVVDISESSMPEIIVKPLGSGGSSDPLNQRASAGWKALFTAVRLNELAMIRIESAATA